MTQSSVSCIFQPQVAQTSDLEMFKIVMNNFTNHIINKLRRQLLEAIKIRRMVP